MKYLWRQSSWFAWVAIVPRNKCSYFLPLLYIHFCPFRQTQYEMFMRSVCVTKVSFVEMLVIFNSISLVCCPKEMEKYWAKVTKIKSKMLCLVRNSHFYYDNTTVIIFHCSHTDIESLSLALLLSIALLLTLFSSWILRSFWAHLFCHFFSSAIYLYKYGWATFFYNHFIALMPCILQ